MPNATLQFPHRRYNPLRKEWVLVSPHRTDRPWQGEVNPASGFSTLAYDPQCYLCPGNTRAGGHVNPPYDGVFVFDNDYAALMPDSPAPTAGGGADPLLVAEQERGRCRVVCFHPDHSLTLARMKLPDIERVVDTWVAQYAELGAQPHIAHIQIFENRGAMMGASNPHPHCQIWATEHVPDEPATEAVALREYRAAHGSCLLCDYVKTESADGARTVCENEDFLAVVPWWAVWPFETLVLSKNNNGEHLHSLADFSAAQRAALADILKQITVRYDNLFETSFPYTMGFHQSPTDGQAHDEWHFHGHFYPPLLRSATVRKFMVGFEMLGMPQRDITPEGAAERLRAVSPIHFTVR
ncbi:MAG TPA: UDP-glucose--hexose-1-phosphate uridylyltransferase [Acidisarcina sp.]